MRPEIVHHDPSMPNPPRVEQSMPVGGANNLLGGGQRGMITNQHPTSAMVSQFGVPIQQQGYSRSEEHTSELQSLTNLVCRLLLEKKKKKHNNIPSNSNT